MAETLSARLEQLIERTTKGNVREFARLCADVGGEVAPSYEAVRNYIHRGSIPPVDKAAIMAKAGRASLAWLATGEGSPSSTETKKPGPHERGPGRYEAPSLSHLSDLGSGKTLEDREREARSVADGGVDGGEREPSDVAEGARMRLKGIRFTLMGEAWFTFDGFVEGPDERRVVELVEMMRRAAE